MGVRPPTRRTRYLLGSNSEQKSLKPTKDENRGTYVACELLELDFSSVVHEVDHPPGTFTNAEVVERGLEQNFGVVRQVAVSDFRLHGVKLVSENGRFDRVFF